MYITQLVDSTSKQCQDFQGVGNVVERHISETDPWNVDFGKDGLNALPYRYTVLRQDRQGSFAKASKLEDHEASRERVLLTIFDPGGCSTCFCHVQLVVSVEI